MSYGCPTCAVGQTSNGPLAGHGVESTKLAAEPGMTLMPASSVATPAMNRNRLKFFSSPDITEPPQRTRGLRRWDTPNVGCDVVVEDEERQRPETVGRRCGLREGRRMDSGLRRVDEEERRAAARPVPRLDCEELVRAELGGAVVHGSDEEMLAGLPGQVLRVPVTGVAASGADVVERSNDRVGVLRQRDDARDLRSAAVDRRDVDGGDERDTQRDQRLRTR